MAIPFRRWILASALMSSMTILAVGPTMGGDSDPTGKLSSSDNDGEIRAQLLKHGDDGKSIRNTRFYFYNGDLVRLKALAMSAGFNTKTSVDGDGLILEKQIAVDATSFAPDAAMMARWAVETGAEYDGWECMVVTAH
jgi:hypothetical protein